MATTYSENTDLKLGNGIAIDDPEAGFFKTGISQAEKTVLMDALRLKSYNLINDMLKGKTAIPAIHISSLKEIEIDLVFSFMIRDSYVLQNYNQSEWQEKYTNSIKTLEKMQFDASADVPLADAENIGDGAMTVHSINNEFARTETWIFQSNNNNQFSVNGTKSGSLPTLTVDIRYPEKDWNGYEQYPFYVTINQGVIPFVQDDKFILYTYAGRFYNISVEKTRRA